MHQRNPSKNILSLFLFLAFTLVIIALFSLYFSEKTVDIKKRELLLEQKYLQLQHKITQKEQEYRKIAENITQIRDEIGLDKTAQHENIAAILTKTTPLMRSMILQNIPAGYPCSSRRITSGFGYRMHPIYHEERFHHGIDFGGKEGLPVHATCDGIVEYAGYSEGGYGNLIIISHNFGFKTLFGHMLPRLKVKKGDFVKKGTIIGYLGNSGLSTGPHLHYEIKYLRHYIDPAAFLKADRNSFAHLLKSSPQIGWQNLITAVTSSYQRFTSL
jgi:murein DD-endopeptidase MepM/ murein hydrolase activator NlpD